MAGHSQYSNIKYRKEAQDGKRAKLFTKVTRTIESAARGGPDPENNSKLRAAIAAARKINMPKQKIEQAIEKGCGSDSTEGYDEIRYECRHTKSGISFIVNALTDNRNRTASEVRSILTKHGAVLLPPGGLLYMFDNVGCIQYTKEGNSPTKILEKAIELGAVDINEDDNFVYIYTEMTDFDRMIAELNKDFGESTEDSRLLWKAKEFVGAQEEDINKLINLLDALEDLDDVQNIDTNAQL